MRCHGTKTGVGLLCLALLTAGVHAAGPPGHADDVASLARRIDHHLASVLAARRVTPAPAATDAEFVRRLYLDVTGRIPRVSEVRTFLDDRRPDKRRRLVDKLLSGPHYVNHFGNVWRSLLLQEGNNQQVRLLAPQMETWARTRLRADMPYDKMVRQLLTAAITFQGPFAGGRQDGRDANAAAFYSANEMKPENLAAATSRLFLGVKLECAQCHDHPFAKWTRKQFWEYTAFFAGIKPQVLNGGVFTPARDDPNVREVTLPGGEKTIKARFLDGSNPTFTEGVGSRVTLAEWLTTGENAFFARAAVNRMWEHFFGLGIVDPADDFRDDNPASHPELLDELAREFAANKFDLKFLIRAITATQAYQRASARTDPSQKDLRFFARMPLKGLSPEQVFDSLATATGYRDDGQPNRGFGFGAQTPRQEFLAKFANPVDRRTEHSTSILQALALMNGKFIADATSLKRSETLAAVIDSPFMDNRQRLDTLYLAALARPMRPHEASRLVPYVARGGPSGDSTKALTDVFWALLNSSEFILNH
jgi:hypothetical protein